MVHLVAITLVKSARNETTKLHNDSRADLLVFFNGTDKAKKPLLDSKPDQYKGFEEICAVRNRHIVKNLPTQYAFMLCPCFMAVFTLCLNVAVTSNSNFHGFMMVLH